MIERKKTGKLFRPTLYGIIEKAFISLSVNSLGTAEGWKPETPNENNTTPGGGERSIKSENF